MTSPLRVQTPPARPLLIYDGDCGFCRRWVERWRRDCAGQVDFLPFQDPSVATRFPEIPRVDFETAVHFILADGMIHRAAGAALRVRALNPHRRFALWLYERCPGFAPLAEFGYRLIARNRSSISKCAGDFCSRD